jgi:hypothetical protein
MKFKLLNGFEVLLARRTASLNDLVLSAQHEGLEDALRDIIGIAFAGWHFIKFKKASCSKVGSRL